MKLVDVTTAVDEIHANALLASGKWQLINVTDSGWHFGSYVACLQEPEPPDWPIFAEQFLAKLDPNEIDKVILDRYADEGLTGGVLSYLRELLRGAA